MNALYEIQEELTHRIVELGNAYPASAKFPRAIRSAGEALSRARSDSDNQLSSEHPDQWGTDVYYPGSRQPSSTFASAASTARAEGRTDHRQLVLAETLSVSPHDPGTLYRASRRPREERLL